MAGQLDLVGSISLAGDGGTGKKPIAASVSGNPVVMNMCIVEVGVDTPIPLPFEGVAQALILLRAADAEDPAEVTWTPTTSDPAVIASLQPGGFIIVFSPIGPMLGTVLINGTSNILFALGVQPD